VQRPKKGFSVPLGAWLRGPLRDWAEALLNRDRLQRERLFDVGGARSLWRAHLECRRDVPYLLWNVLMFQAWRDAAPG
jgi:asparagine synthase (glutamine-hydrolysing)